MTEQDWLTSTDPKAMLDWLCGGRPHLGEPAKCSGFVTDRKLRLWCAAVASLAGYNWAGSNWMWGEANLQEESSPYDAARIWASKYATEKLQGAAPLLRDIFGNPFRPVTLPKIQVACPQCGAKRWLPAGPSGDVMWCRECRKRFPWPSNAYTRPWLTWCDGTIPKLAQAIYAKRAFDQMPILADALEEAGCDNDDVLRHCREEYRINPACDTCGERGFIESGLLGRSFVDCPGCTGRERILVPHVRGCWVLDLLLGKE